MFHDVPQELLEPILGRVTEVDDPVGANINIVREGEALALGTHRECGNHAALDIEGKKPFVSVSDE